MPSSPIKLVLHPRPPLNQQEPEPKLTSPPEDPSRAYEPKDPAQLYKAAQRDHSNGSIGNLVRITPFVESLASDRRFEERSQYNNRNNQTKVVDPSYPYLAYIIELCASAVSAASVPSARKRRHLRAVETLPLVERCGGRKVFAGVLEPSRRAVFQPDILLRN